MSIEARYRDVRANDHGAFVWYIAKDAGSWAGPWAYAWIVPTGRPYRMSRDIMYLTHR